MDPEIRITAARRAIPFTCRFLNFDCFSPVFQGSGLILRAMLLSCFFVCFTEAASSTRKDDSLSSKKVGGREALLPYSARSASIGSRFDARQAG